MNDVTRPKKVVEISLMRKGSERTLWVNIDGRCELRVNCIGDDVHVESDMHSSNGCSAYHLIRPNIIESLKQYGNEHRPVGSFLRAFLSNDLMETVGRADEDNLSVIPQIAGYIYNELPIACHGSSEAVARWLA